MASKDYSMKNGQSQSIGGFSVCGYQVDDMNNHSDRFKCAYCKHLIKEPLQLMECGHRVCKGCFEQRAAVISENEEMICPDPECTTPFRKTDIMIDRAFKRELDRHIVVCFSKRLNNCPWTGFLKDYQEHIDQNHVRYTCDLCGDDLTSLQSLSTHQNSECPAIFQKCPLGRFCTEESIKKSDFRAHLITEQHQNAICILLTTASDITESTEKKHEMEVDTEIEHLEQQVSEKLSALATAASKLSEDAVQTSQEFIKIDELSQMTAQQLDDFQEAINAHNNALNALQEKQQKIQEDVEKLKNSLTDTQVTSTDGTLTWRVDRVSEKMLDAQTERVTSIFSPIFYSEPTGYKMRARLYLHGDGAARRTHISLFFLLMKGEYDSILPWPFSHKVTFCLFDQTGANRHIIDSFRPDTKSSSFSRPVADSNIASGIPKFFPLPMLQQDNNSYVRNDTMFLKIIVDLREMPKLLLPYALSLNPGFPSHIQQLLIKQEIAKKEAETRAANAS